MPKVILEYNLPEDLEAYETTMSARKIHLALTNFYTYVLRRALQYSSSDNQELHCLLTDDKKQDATLQVIELLRDEFHRILQEQGLDF